MVGASEIRIIGVGTDIVSNGAECFYAQSGIIQIVSFVNVLTSFLLFSWEGCFHIYVQV